MTARIIGIGAYAPEQVVTNQDLTKFLDTNDAWIRERTGIGARHISTSEGTSALATEAAKRAIADAGISPEEIEIVIVATSSPDRAFPSAADELWVAEKFQSNPEIAGSPRNSFRTSLNLDIWR